jgi:hypothetical protein
MGNLMRAACGVAPATLLILFDYKYFFHALAYMARDVWKTGCAVPAREAPALQQDDYGTQARIITALQYTDDSVKACLGATATVTTIVEFCRLIGPRFYPGPDAHESARGTVARSVLDEYGVALQAWRQLSPKGSVRAIGRDAREPPGTCTVPTGRGTAGGNPFPVTTGQNVRRSTTHSAPTSSPGTLVAMPPRMASPNRASAHGSMAYGGARRSATGQCLRPLTSPASSSSRLAWA